MPAVFLPDGLVLSGVVRFLFSAIGKGGGFVRKRGFRHVRLVFRRAAGLFGRFLIFARAGLGRFLPEGAASVFGRGRCVVGRTGRRRGQAGREGQAVFPQRLLQEKLDGGGQIQAEFAEKCVGPGGKFRVKNNGFRHDESRGSG